VLVIVSVGRFVYDTQHSSYISDVIPSQQVSVVHKDSNQIDHTVYVSRVVDGDTIEVVEGDTKQKVRLLGINAPESVDPRRTVECFGKEASSYLKQILEHRLVSIHTDGTQSTYDKYHRLLGYVYRDDGLFVNKHMIEEGYAYEYTYSTPYQYQSDFRQAQQQARTEEKGLWAKGVCMK
jgi:micrococcal nuclease